jgi:hypothetical protein
MTRWPGSYLLTYLPGTNTRIVPHKKSCLRFTDTENLNDNRKESDRRGVESNLWDTSRLLPRVSPWLFSPPSACCNLALSNEPTTTAASSCNNKHHVVCQAIICQPRWSFVCGSSSSSTSRRSSRRPSSGGKSSQEGQEFIRRVAKAKTRFGKEISRAVTTTSPFLSIIVLIVAIVFSYYYRWHEEYGLSANSR